MSDPAQWQVSGNAPQAYECYMVPTLFTPWAQDLLARAALHAGERVLDVACGTGIVARLAAERVGPSGYVLGVDRNAAMLETARAQMPTAGVPVEWREGDAHGFPCADATFDVVCCQQGVQFFPDKAHALREMQRGLAPGGRLVLSVWRSLPYNPYGPVRWRTRWSVTSVLLLATGCAHRMGLARWRRSGASSRQRAFEMSTSTS
jgi:ubiquinone/menaquinone biosynthesis C-methylase UbiE